MIYFILFIFSSIVLLSLPEIYSRVRNFEITDHNDIKIARLRWTFGYLGCGIFLFLIILTFKLLYIQGILQIYNKYYAFIKFTFCFASSCIGFYLLAFKARSITRSKPMPSYLIYYPVLLIIVSMFSFLVISKFLEQDINGYSFYLWAFPISTFLGFFVDNLLSLKG